ncbi:DUF488 domain-containing protein [Zafaria sp. Z1313]|uniref:DUF488 domain-containing protein n=1 Tax=Zafaria sp. Z1313 TaxID=3423202 RepID=UPI003D30275E
MGTIRLLRAYDPPDGGYRVLVDRLWPRGLAKADAHLDDWAKDAAPSHELRRWFHAGGSFDGFRERYLHELHAGPAAEGAERLRGLVREHEDVVFVYAGRTTGPNHATVLRDDIVDAAGGGRPE